jgi:hypothetical protein
VGWGVVYTGKYTKPQHLLLSGKIYGTWRKKMEKANICFGKGT